jgi:N-acetylglucosamine kinase-like BadF-type ATPase
MTICRKKPKKTVAQSSIPFDTGPMDGFYLGLDGGGPKCRLAAWDENREQIYRDEGESANVYAVGFERASANVQALLEACSRAPALARKRPKALCFGSAGLARKTERERWKAFFDRFYREPFPRLLSSDAELMLAGSLHEPTGLGLFAGTGAICMGRNEDGELVRSGGMGSMLGDEGSAWWIAREAARRTLRSIEDRDLPTTMDKTIRSFFHLRSMADCIAFFNDKDLPKTTVASFAPYVSAAAEQGDLLAQAIVGEAADELAKLVRSVESRLGGTFLHRITLNGSVLEQDKTIRKLFLGKLPSTLVVCPNKGTALDGAGILAFTLA